MKFTKTNSQKIFREYIIMAKQATLYQQLKDELDNEFEGLKARKKEIINLIEKISPDELLNPTEENLLSFAVSKFAPLEIVEALMNKAPLLLTLPSGQLKSLPLHTAMLTGYTKAINFFVDMMTGEQLIIEDSFGRSSLDFADKNNTNNLRIYNLIKQKLNTEYKESTGETEVHVLGNADAIPHNDNESS